MRNAILCAVLLPAVCLATGCATPGKAVAPEDQQAVRPAAESQALTRVEAESLVLTKCTAEPLKGASGGRAVLMSQEGGEARGSAVLTRGRYEVMTYARGTSSDEDAVFITVGGGQRQRVWCQDHGNIVQAVLRGTLAPSFTVTVNKDGPVEIVLQMAEKNVYVDCIVFKRLGE